MSSFISRPGEFYTTNLNPPSITIKGLSTDTKPSATTFAGLYFYETDTNSLYLAYNGIWNKLATTTSGGGGGSGIGSKFTANGGGTTFTIPHGLGVVPTFVEVGAGSTDARGTFSWTADANNITVTYPVATPSGTNNVILWWTAGTLSSPIAINGGNTNAGTATQSGNASTKVFTIPHGLASTPSNVVVEPNSTDALGDFTWTVDSTNITITYQVAPPSGTNNLTWNWIAAFNTSISGFTTSSTDTLLNKTIDASLNTIKNIGYPATYAVYLDSNDSLYKARNTQTGAIQVSSATAETVIQTIVNSSGVVAYFQNGAFTLSAGFTGFTVKGNNQLICGPQTIFRVPNGYNGTVFTLLDVASTVINGGQIDEAGTPSALWTGLKLQSSSATGCTQLRIQDFKITNPSTGVLFVTDTSSSAYINNIQLSRVTIMNPVIGVDFQMNGISWSGGDSAPYIGDNLFENIYIECAARTTFGFKNVRNMDNTFIQCKVFDTQLGNSGAGCPSATMSVDCKDNMILKGIMANSQFVDPSRTTLVIDNWNYTNALLFPNLKKVGMWQGPNISAGGLFGLIGQVATNGTFTTPSMVVTDGLATRLDTGATQNTLAVARTSANVTCRGFNPNLFCRFRVNQTDQNCRIFIGFKNSSSMPNSDDPLNAVGGFALVTISTDTHFQLANDSGVGATTLTPLAAIDTNIHTIQLQADDNNSRWGYSLDGAAMTWVTTAIPAQTLGLSYVWGIVNSGAAASKTMDHFYTTIVADK